jgi:hypothetical protein
VPGFKVLQSADCSGAYKNSEAFVTDGLDVGENAIAEATAYEVSASRPVVEKRMNARVGISRPSTEPSYELLSPETVAQAGVNAVTVRHLNF